MDLQVYIMAVLGGRRLKTACSPRPLYILTKRDADVVIKTQSVSAARTCAVLRGHSTCKSYSP